MWSYYELTTAQAQADRVNDAGYTLPPAAQLEFPQDVIRRALVQQGQEQDAEKQEGRRANAATIINTIRTVLRGPAIAR